MSVKRVLYSNNTLFSSCCSSLHFISGTSRDVFLTVRDQVHQGWKLLTHPLYGNFLPSQQPYRSLLLESPKQINLVDAESFGYLEEALGIYRAYESTLRVPGSYRASIEEDYALMDRYLLEESLRKYGLWKERAVSAL